MQAWTDFFAADHGLTSAAVIAVTLGMGVFCVRLFLKHMGEDEERASRTP